MQAHLRRPTSSIRVWTRVAIALLLTAFGVDARGQTVDGWNAPALPPLEAHALEGLDPEGILPESRDERPRLTLDPWREVWLAGIAGRLWIAGELLPEEARTVPVQGLDPGQIRWSLDRSVVGNHDPGASRRSDRTRDVSLVLPVLLFAVTARSKQRWRDFAVGGAIYAEALLLTKSVTHLGKVALGRPRPGNYVAQPEASDPASPQAAGSGRFHSLPSSHASTAWTGASTAVTTHLLLRPRAHGLERFGLGFVGGALAGATSALRISSGAHFPTDVIAGAGIGIASGVLVPLLHRDGRRLPSRRAVLQSVGGVAAGTLLGVLLGG